MSLSHLMESDLAFHPEFTKRLQITIDTIAILDNLEKQGLDSDQNLWEVIELSSMHEALTILIEALGDWCEQAKGGYTIASELDEVSAIAQHDAISHLMMPIFYAYMSLNITKDTDWEISDIVEQIPTSLNALKEKIVAYIHYYYCLETCQSGSSLTVSDILHSIEASKASHINLKYDNDTISLSVEVFVAFRTLLLNSLQAVARVDFPNELSDKVDVSISTNEENTEIILVNDILNEDMKVLQHTIESAGTTDTNSIKGGLRLVVKLLDRLQLQHPNSLTITYEFLEMQDIKRFQIKFVIKKPIAQNTSTTLLA